MQDKQYPTVHAKGINKDRLFQEANDVTFALNAIRDNHEGGRVEYQSEPGNELAASLPNGYILIGTIYGQDNEVFLFSKNGNGQDEIGRFKQGYYETLANLQLGFNDEYPITGEYRIRNGCDQVLYWSDYYNNDYWYNVSKPNEFKTSGVFDPNKFKFSPVVTVPKIDLLQVNSSGGSLALGSYYIQVEQLDKNLNTIYRTDISPQTIIYDEDQSDAFYLIDGGLNTPQYDPYVGGVPVTNKSITFRFSNLDTSFAYLRVNIIRQIAGTQVIDAHSVGSLIPITQDSIDWTYIGYNVNGGDYPVDYSSLLIDNVKYDSSLVQEQVQGRLVRANLKQTVRDYGNYQRFVSEITSRWVSDVVDSTDAYALGNPKNPNTYWYKTTFQGDEIQALGVRFLHNDGTWSPVFHNPGRPSVPDDLQLLTVVANSQPTLGANEIWVSDVEHLPDSEFTVLTNDYIGSTIETWRVLNTATRDINSGTMGYYETDTTYPDIRDCTGELIWGLDSNGDPITTSTKIRHHRFPDRRLLTHYNGTNILPYGIQFDNIVYPSVDIVAHQFCQADRTEFDKTVLDSGWAVCPSQVNVSGQDTLLLRGPFSTFITNSYARYNSAEIFFNQKLFNADYLKLNRGYHLTSTPVTFSSFATFPVVLAGDDKDLKMNIYHMRYDSDAIVTRTNHKINKQVYTPPNTYTGTTNFTIAVDTTANRLTGDSVIDLNYPLENLTSLLGSQSFGQIDGDPGSYISNNFYTYKKKNNKPFSNLFSINYTYLNFNPIYSLDTNDNILFNGDSLISLCSVFRENALNQGFGDLIYEPISSLYMWEEHQINSCMRHAGNNDDTLYYKITEDNTYLLKKIADLNENERYVIRQSDQFRKEYYSYNKDYDVQAREQAKIQLPFNYDYCLLCSGIYKHRIVFSPKSYDEENIDLYRVNKVNDYIDLPGHRGQITGLKYKNNQLLVHTEDTTFILQPNPQTVATDQNTAYLTTGDFLSIPPQELIQTDIGFGGCQDKLAQADSPFGWCWVDQKRGDVLMFDNKINVIAEGLTQWLKENLPSETLNAIYSIYHLPYQWNTTFTQYGRGLILYYDPRFKRLIITKKDYNPIEFETGRPNSTHYDYEDRIWGAIIDDNTVSIDYGDPNYFENKSWTLSYNFLDQSYCSWHSYNPSLAFSDSDYFYTTNLTKRIYRHLHKEKYQNYYETKYDFIVEWSNFNPMTSTESNVYYIGYTHVWDSNSKQFKLVDTTFDRLLMYNFDQTTGLQNLTLQNQHSDPYQNNKLLSSSKSVIKTDQNYKISGLYDMATGSPVITSNQDLVKLYNGYIDIVPNTANINFNKSQYDWGNLWDKFVFVRLFFKPSSDHRKSVILQVLNNHQSVR